MQKRLGCCAGLPPDNKAGYLRGVDIEVNSLLIVLKSVAIEWLVNAMRSQETGKTYCDKAGDDLAAKKERGKKSAVLRFAAFISAATASRGLVPTLNNSKNIGGNSESLRSYLPSILLTLAVIWPVPVQ